MTLEPGEAVICLGCGQPMAARAGLAVCSHRCRKRELRARHRRDRRRVCLGCRRNFCPTRKDARFCSDACRFKAYRAKREAKAVQAIRPPTSPGGALISLPASSASADPERPA